MGFSTHAVQPDNIIAELESTSDPALFKYLGREIRVLTVGREYKTEIDWQLSDHGHLIGFYNQMFADFKL